MEFGVIRGIIRVKLWLLETFPKMELLETLKYIEYTTISGKSKLSGKSWLHKEFGVIREILLEELLE